MLGDASVSITSEFDDILNGVDFVVRYPSDEGNELYMGVDVKTIKGGKPDYRINDSIEKSLEDTRRRRLKKIKYFIDPQDDKKTYLDVPRIVVVFDSDEIIKYQEMLIVPIKKRTLRQRDMMEILRKKMIDQMKGNCALIAERIEDMKTSPHETGFDKIYNYYKGFMEFLEQQPR